MTVATDRLATLLEAADPVAVVGNHIRAWRIARELTQVELSAATGILQVSISQYELGRRTMSVVIAVRIAYALGLSIDALLTTEP